MDGGAPFQTQTLREMRVGAAGKKKVPKCGFGLIGEIADTGVFVRTLPFPGRHLVFLNFRSLSSLFIFFIFRGVGWAVGGA